LQDEASFVKLRYRPHDPHSHPLFGERQKENGLLLRISRPRDQPAAGGVVQEQAQSISILAAASWQQHPGSSILAAASWQQHPGSSRSTISTISAHISFQQVLCTAYDDLRRSRDLCQS
jgi:hypothetical protein